MSLPGFDEVIHDPRRGCASARIENDADGLAEAHADESVWGVGGDATGLRFKAMGMVDPYDPYREVLVNTVQ